MHDMEDTQNSAPNSVPAAQAAKLGGPKRAQDAHSTTKRYFHLSSQSNIILILR